MENIQVTVRVRPSNPFERDGNDLEIWQILNGDSITIAADRYNDLVRMRKFLPSQRVEFSYNQCFDQKQTTYSLYNQQIRRITISALSGINGTIFMYGQTGSGKTFTMMGPSRGDVSGQLTHHKNSSGSGLATATPKNLLKELPPSNVRQTQTQSYRSNPRNNSHRSPSHKTKDKTPSRQDSMGGPGSILAASNDGDTPDKLGGLSKKNQQPNDCYKQLQFESENDCRNQEGILSLALQDLFSEIEKVQQKKKIPKLLQTDKQFLLRCSYIEIYTDQVYDLLKPQDHLSEILSINEDSNVIIKKKLFYYQKEFYIKGATEEIVSSIDEILDMIHKGEINRHYASTIMNHVSSRSHTIFRLYVRCIPTELETPNNVITESILNFVDLAGSEKINIHDAIMKKRGSSVSSISSIGQCTATNTFKDRTNESKHINKSLFYLTQVISLKSQGSRDQHIPYRNSPLTKILRSSLGGNSRTAIILCVNPCFSQFEQTLSTLRFGSNAKQIRNNVQKNIVNCDTEEAIQKIIGDYERKFLEMEQMHHNKNENLQKIIERLQERAQFCNRTDKQPLITPEHLQQLLITGIPQKPKSWSHIHYPGVGILQVPENDDSDSNSSRCEDKSFQENVNKREYNLNEQLKLVEVRSGILQQQLDDSNRRKNDIIQQIQKIERKYNQAKKNISNQKLQQQALQEENRKLRTICGIFHGHLSSNQLMFLDTDTIDKISQNLIIMQETMLKVKIQKELYTRTNENDDQIFFKMASIDTLRVHQDLSRTIKYPQFFLDNKLGEPLTQYWENMEVDEGQSKRLKTINEEISVENITLNSISLRQAPELDSFQTYFHQQFHSVGNSLVETLNVNNDLDQINRQLTMLKSDYNVLKVSPIKRQRIMQGTPIHNPDIPTGLSAIQNYKDTGPSYQQKVYSTQIVPSTQQASQNYLPQPLASIDLHNSQSSQIDDKHKYQINDLLSFQQSLLQPDRQRTNYEYQPVGKENGNQFPQYFDFSKKTNSVPLVDDGQTFNKFFEQRKYGKQY